MANPFGAIKSWLGSFAEYVGNNNDEYRLYQKYGPNYRNVVDDIARQEAAQAYRMEEDARRARAEAGTAELNQEIKKAERTKAFTEAYEATRGMPLDYKKYIPTEVGKPGTDDLIPVEAVAGQLNFEEAREQKMLEEIREKEKHQAELKAIETAIAENNAQTDAALAEAAATRSLKQQRDVRTGLLPAESAALVRQRDRANTGGTAEGGDADEAERVPVAERSAMIISAANRERYNREVAQGNKVAYEEFYDDLNQIPEDILDVARESVNVKLRNERKAASDQAGDKGFMVQVGGSGKVFKERDPAIERSIKNKLQTGEPLSEFEEAYWRAVAARR